MSGSLQNRLLKYQEQPPADTWERIASRLDTEFAPGDTQLSIRLEEYSVAPPPAMWDRVNTGLDSIEAAPPPVRRMSARKIAIAAAVLVAVVAGYFYFANNNVGSESRQGAKVLVDNTTQRPLPDDKARASVLPSQERDSITTHAGEVQPSTERESGQSRTIARRTSSRARVVSYAETESNLDGLPTMGMETVHAVQPIAVSAPPIRDRNGNIIMDMQVISKPGQQYITITGPNGNQTKISAKFLNCLRYINSNAASADYDPDAIDCLNKFAEWRNKLISDGAFIPTGENFFDIFELKEMLQD